MMKKLLFSILTLFIFLFPSKSFALENWVITNFNSDIYLHQDTTVDVVEKIDVDFKNLAKHGIYRDIPIKYEDALGNNLDIRFDLGWVSEDGERPETIETEKIGDNIRVKLGSASKTKSGPHTYTISYTIRRVITQPGDYAEFYWNATGFDWEVPIENATVRISAPTNSIADSVCYTGTFGSKFSDCFLRTSGDQVEASSETINPGSNLTVSVKLDKNSFAFPTFQEELSWFLQDNWPYIIPFIVLGLMIFRYWVKGRDYIYKDLFHDAKSRTIIKPLFYRMTPALLHGPIKDIPPGVVGTIADERVHLRDITATIIDLARRGFITIEELEKNKLSKTEFIFHYNEQAEDKLIDYEKKVLDTFFGTSRANKHANLKKLPTSSYSHYDEAIKLLYQHVHDNGYFTANPQSTRNKYIVLAVAVMIFGFFLTSSGTFRFGLPVLISGIIILPFSFFMPARSAKGSRVLRDITGLREWIRIGAWREQIHEKHNFIEEVLPYTIAFGLTYKFIKALKASDLKNLDWYQSNRPFSVHSFNNSINSIGYRTSSSINATRPKSSSSGGSSFSGGGGFSGGGFGGGGGGSW